MLILATVHFLRGTGIHRLLQYPFLYVPNEQNEVQLNEFFITAISIIILLFFWWRGGGGGMGRNVYYL